MASLDWRLVKLCSLRAVEGRVHRRRYKLFGESDMHRLSKQGVPDSLIMATSGNKSFESTKIDSRRTPSTTVDGCLAGRRPLCGRQKKLAIAQPDKMEKLRKPLESILFVSWCTPDDPCNIQISQQCASCRGMWGQQSKQSDFGWTGLHPDLSAARLGLDLPGSARILVLDCISTRSTDTKIGKNRALWVFKSNHIYCSLGRSPRGSTELLHRRLLPPWPLAKGLHKRLTSGAHAWSPAGLLFAKSFSLVGTVHRDCHASWRVTKQMRPE